MTQFRGQAGWRRSPWAVPAWLAFSWGLAESTVLFVVPDLVVGWACLAGWRQGLRALAAVMAGSLLGGLLMYATATAWPDAMRHVVADVPFVRPDMFKTVEAAYKRAGAAGMLEGPGSGIPYKVYAVLAPPSFGAMRFALYSVPARLERLVLSFVAFAALGQLARRRIEQHPRFAATLFVLFWTIVYAFYWGLL
jgi:hypothetical protein